jgi:hypothetical protein
MIPVHCGHTSSQSHHLHLIGDHAVKPFCTTILLMHVRQGIPNQDALLLQELQQFIRSELSSSINLPFFYDLTKLSFHHCDKLFDMLCSITLLPDHTDPGVKYEDFGNCFRGGNKSHSLSPSGRGTQDASQGTWTGGMRLGEVWIMMFHSVTRAIFSGPTME